MQPGVQLAVGVPTTGSLVADIQSAMAGAVGSNQLVNAYKAQNGVFSRLLLDEVASPQACYMSADEA